MQHMISAKNENRDKLPKIATINDTDLSHTITATVDADTIVESKNAEAESIWRYCHLLKVEVKVWQIGIFFANPGGQLV